MPESIKDKMNRAEKTLTILKSEYPDSKTALNFSNPLELLIATILSAQCTDERVNKVTIDLFKKYKSPDDYASVAQEELGQDIKSTGFFNNKAKSIQNCCSALIENHNSEIPGNMNDLVRLPGVGRKTANVILGIVFGIPGITVDTHVKRISGKLGFSDQTNPDKIEQDLMKIIPEPEWTKFSHMIIDHGRKICSARKPLCGECTLNKYCPSSEVPRGK